MNKNDKKVFLYGLGSLLIGTVIRSAARQIWKSTNNTPAPDNPADPEVNTTHAMLWTVSLAVLSGFGKLLYRSAFGADMRALNEEASIIIPDEE